jgi:hypothetical protein
VHADHAPEGYRRKRLRDIKRLHLDRRERAGHPGHPFVHLDVGMATARNANSSG